MSKLASREISIFSELVYVSEETGLSLALSETPRRFSHVAAHMLSARIMVV